MLYRNKTLFVLLLFPFWLRAQPEKAVGEFARRLDTIRQQLKIPGMAAAVMEGDSILFAQGFGYADVKNKVRATAKTSFRVASVTKTFTSTLIMQLVEKGRLDLNTAVSDYGLDFGNPSIKVKHLLTHTSEGQAGTYFQYNGYRYGRLGPVIEQAAGIPFYQLLMEQIIQPAGMQSSAPAVPLSDYFRFTEKQKGMRHFFENAFTHLARPYELTASGNIVETSYLDEFGAFGGLVTTVGDLLKYSRAIDQHRFISGSTQQQVFTANRTKDGTFTPYGLGWFVQRYKGVDFYWHYGQTQGESALFLKVPARKLTFVVLANTDKLSQPFPLGDGDIFTSPLGQLFYRYFINDGKTLYAINYRDPLPVLQTVFSQPGFTAFNDFYNKEIITHSVMDKISGDTSHSLQLLQLYAVLNFKNKKQLNPDSVIAAIRDVSINQDISKPFTLTATTAIRVYGVGENCSPDFSSWCDYGWIEDSTGKVIWQMQGKPATGAGGAVKNKQVNVTIELPAGHYTVRFKSDWAHAYNNWDSAPPENYVWGIFLLKAK